MKKRAFFKEPVELANFARQLSKFSITSMFDNFVWLPRACVPGGVRSKKGIRTSLFLSDRMARVSAPAPRVFTLKDSLQLEVHFRGRAWPWN